MDLKLTRITLLPLFVGIAVACTPVPRRIPEGLQEVAAVTVLQTPQPRPDALAGPNATQIKHGRYLAELIGCGACHTDGAIVGEPNQTGLGNWTDAQIVDAIRSGTRQHGSGRLIVMSWPLYQGMSDEDVNAIVAYLRSIPPVKHQVPAAVTPGTKAPSQYVRFGLYRSST